MPAKFQRALLPVSGGLPPPLIVKCCGFTLIQVDVVLPLLLVPCAVVSGALQDVSPVSDVMPDGHLLQPAVRVPDGPPSLPDPAWGRAHLGSLLVDLGGTVARVGVGDDSGGRKGLAITSGCHVLHVPNHVVHHPKHVHEAARHSQHPKGRDGPRLHPAAGRPGPWHAAICDAEEGAVSKATRQHPVHVLTVNGKGVHQEHGVLRLHVPHEAEHPDFSSRGLHTVPDPGSAAHPAGLASRGAAGSGLAARDAGLVQA